MKAGEEVTDEEKRAGKRKETARQSRSRKPIKKEISGPFDLNASSGLGGKKKKGGKALGKRRVRKQGRRRA